MILEVKIIYDIIKNSRLIKKSIKKYGYFAEHSFMHYLNSQTSLNKNIFFDYGNDKGLLMQFNKKNNVWSLFPCGILAPENERLGLLMDASNYALKKRKAKKLIAEVSEDLRKKILKRLSLSNGLRVCSYTNILYWPTYNLSQWDPKLKGKRMKKLRNIKNKFYKKNRVMVKETKNVPKEKLKKIFLDWMRKRYKNDKINKEYYLNLIDNNFKGTDIAKTIYVNGKPATITAGWRIPNSRDYYSAIGIIDYSYSGLGEIANIDDLSRLKRYNFDNVDFGGSDKMLLRFKMKFKPEKVYKTYTFSIVRR